MSRETAPGSAGPRVSDESINGTRELCERAKREGADETVISNGKAVELCDEVLNARAALASLRAQNERLREALEDALEFIRRDLSRRAEDGSPPLSRAEVIIAAERALASTDTGETSGGGTK